LRKHSFINIYVGRKVSLHRLAQRKSQENLANLLELSLSEYTSLEMGHESFLNAQLTAIAEYFSIPFSDFFPKPKDMRPDTSNPDMGIKYKST